VDDLPKVTSEKPAIPTLWLDTAVIIKFTKLARGEALQPIEVDRLTPLKTLVKELIGSGKLLCPEADQEEEYSIVAVVQAAQPRSRHDLTSVR
jgi:hypothetical protein